MLDRLIRDWLIFIMLAGIICFFIYAFVNSRREERKIKKL